MQRPRVFSLRIARPWTHARKCKHARTHASTQSGRVWRCLPVVQVLATTTHSGVACLSDTREQEKEMVCVTSPPLPLPPLQPPSFFFLFFLPLTVRWMIAITGAISETKWRSMGQRDTAMGIQPSDCCAAMGTLGCLFVWVAAAVVVAAVLGRVGLLFICIFPLFQSPPAPRTHTFLPASV